MTDHREQLRQIKTFPSLVRFLRDELDWPVETEDFEELTFDYSPEELGIDPASAAKIEEIKRLRPLVANQPWGIFFVKFEPKQLPVVALRRILAGVVVKKRATASAAEQPKWVEDDLLFISNYGEGDQRKISFAHFSKDPAKSDLPTLKVIAWDELDTPLHLDHTADLLVERLSWPADKDEWDGETWRERWSSAFELRHREVITTSKVLAERLAELARRIRAEILRVIEIETEDGKVTRLMKSFQETLVDDLDADGFADMYAQTIAYGLLSARIADPHAQTADDLAAHMRTSPFLRELLETFLQVGGRRGKAGGPGIDFDELGVGDVVALLDDANMEAVVLDFGDKNPLEDPVIHFYEHFLSEYDKRLKIQRGVFYTPQPVVSYIVRSVHELLQTEFGLADGLADTTTWGEMLKKHPGLSLPPLTDEPDETSTIPLDEPFVQILDPATGTATFPVEVIDVIHRTLSAKWKQQRLTEAQQCAAWNDYVPKHLLPRLHAFELMMAPYAIAHMKIGLKLAETGYRFATQERARIYLTNALEPWQKQLKLPDFDALAHEATSVNEVKRHKRFTVVIGNPPYSVLSANLSDEARALVDSYRNVDGVPIKEKSMLRLEMHLQDDYIKFVSLSEKAIRASGSGIVGLITNSGYLDSLSLRGMRFSLVDTFDKIAILNLHGSQQQATDRTRELHDKNVFDIVQGVAILLGVTSRDRERSSTVQYDDLVGERSAKYEALLTSTISDHHLAEFHPTSPRYYFVPRDDEREYEFQLGTPIVDLFQMYITGMVTAHDHLVIDFSDENLKKTTGLLRDEASDDDAVRRVLAVKDNAGWKLSKARIRLRETEDSDNWYCDLDYRPFDQRRINYHPALVWSDRRQLMQHMMQGSNIAISTCRQLSALPWTHVFVGRRIVESAFVSNKSREICHVMPLWLLEDTDSLLGDASSLRSNLSAEATNDFLRGRALTNSEARVLSCMYAELHSAEYRERYAEFLKRDYPRVFAPQTEALFDELARLGGELIALHLLESPKLAAPITEFVGGRHPEVGRVGWSDNTVWVDAGKTNAREGHRATVSGSVGFSGVPEDVWRFQIGGYQVCHKWLKDRKGRTLTDDDIAHYEKIVVAISETIRLMKEIDDVIDAHGGWPGAFFTSSDEEVLAEVAASADE